MSGAADKGACPVLRASQVELLRRVAAEDVGWFTEYRRRGYWCSYRLWSSELEYVTVTPQIKRLLALGLVRKDDPSFGRRQRGPVGLTPAGRSALDITDSPGAGTAAAPDRSTGDAIGCIEASS